MKILMAFGLAAVVAVVWWKLNARSKTRSVELMKHDFFVDPNTGGPSEARFCINLQTMIDYYQIRPAYISTHPSETDCRMELELRLSDGHEVVLVTTFEPRGDDLVMIRSHLDEGYGSVRATMLWSQANQPIVWGYTPKCRGFPMRHDVLMELLKILKMHDKS